MSSLVIVGRSFVMFWVGCCFAIVLVVGCWLFFAVFLWFFFSHQQSLSVCLFHMCPHNKTTILWCFCSLFCFVCFSLTLYSQKAASLDVNWEGAGKEPGNLIWRVENKRDASGNPDFGIRVWPKDRYGEFYTGDSYIVLHTSKEEGSDALQWDIYFWIGSQSSQDEYGVGTCVYVCVCVWIFWEFCVCVCVCLSSVDVVRVMRTMS